MKKKRLIIVGGVAGGASCATRARRMSEEIEIILIDRGPYVSFANCGLPYYVGNVIKEESNLLVATEDLFKKRFNIEVRTNSEVISIHKGSKEIEIKNRKTGDIYSEKYDALLLSPGASPVRPHLPGIDLPGIFALRTIPDSRLIRDWIDKKKARKAIIVGAGFIGLEMMENLVNRGIETTIIELQNQIMPAMDPEMVSPLHDYLQTKGVKLILVDSVTGFEESKNGKITVILKSGKNEITDIVILSIGVKPEITLAKNGGLEIGSCGGIRVNERMQTSDPYIWAVGDAVEVRDYITGQWSLIPLAGPANRQGRIAADNIIHKLEYSDTPNKNLPQFRGTQGTFVVKIFDRIIASTGASEKSLNHAGIRDYDKIYLHPGHHANYYPGAKPIDLKLIFSTKDGRILGAQAVGEEGIEKRIDVISMAIQRGSTVFDLEEAELCYAPQFGAAKDPVNVAGMIASNILQSNSTLAHWEKLDSTKPFLLDVRDTTEYQISNIQGSVNIPLSELRNRMNELPKDREIWIHCGVGQRSYYATRALIQNGYNVKNLSGGLLTYKAFKDIPASQPK